MAGYGWFAQAEIEKGTNGELSAKREENGSNPAKSRAGGYKNMLDKKRSLHFV